MDYPQGEISDEQLFSKEAVYTEICGAVTSLLPRLKGLETFT